MKALSGQKNLYLLGTTYYFRKTIPRDLLPFFGKIEYKKSLATRHFKEACRKAWALNSAAEWFFEVLRHMAETLTTKQLTDLVKGHFEMQMLRAEDAFFLEKYLAPSDGIFEPMILTSMLERSQRRTSLLSTQRKAHTISPEIEATAERILSQANASCPRTNPLFYQLCSGLLRGQLEAERINSAFLSGNEKEGEIQDPFFADCRNYFLNPDSATLWENQSLDYVPRTATTKATVLTLGAALDAYFAYKKTETGLRDTSAQKQLEARTSKLKLFVPASKPITGFSHEDGWSLREKILQLPSNTHHLTDQETLELMASGREYKRISPATIGSYWQFFGMFFTHARKRKWITENPLEDISPSIKKEKSVQRRSFTQSELGKLFSSPLFTGHSTQHRERWEAGSMLVKDGQYWVPLVALYQGMRMGEILGLMKEDVESENGVWTLHVRKNGRRRVKNFNSDRKLPVHAELERLGFIDYLHSRLSALKSPSGLIFEDGITIPVTQKITKNVSRNFGKYLDKLGLTDRALVFHSFRHNFCTAMASRSDIPMHVMDLLDGRSAGSDTRSSSRGSSRVDYLHFDIATLKSAIDKVDLGVDLSHLYPT